MPYVSCFVFVWIFLAAPHRLQGSKFVAFDLLCNSRNVEINKDKRAPHVLHCAVVVFEACCDSFIWRERVHIRFSMGADATYEPDRTIISVAAFGDTRDGFRARIVRI